MSAQSCYPGDHIPYPWYPYLPYGTAGYPLPTYGTTTVIATPITEDRLREVIREELRAILEKK
jgi:hypothetical protein